MSQCDEDHECCVMAGTLIWSLKVACGCDCHNWVTYDDED